MSGRIDVKRIAKKQTDTGESDSSGEPKEGLHGYLATLVQPKEEWWALVQAKRPNPTLNVLESVSEIPTGDGDGRQWKETQILVEVKEPRCSATVALELMQPIKWRVN